MRQLEVVALSDDGTQVLLARDSDSGRATHQIRLDDRLLAAVHGQLDTSERRPSELTPKEIQARLRAGESVEQVAKAAKVPVARVQRYAGPVESERDRVVEQARAAPLVRPRGKVASQPLGEVVDRRLLATPGFRPDSVAWSASRREDGAWRVLLTYSARGSRRATWLWQPSDQQLTPLDIAGSRLGGDEPSGPGKRAGTARTGTARKGTGRTVTGRKVTGRSRTGRGATAAKATTRTTRKATTRKVTTRKPTTRKPTTRKATVRKAASAAAGARRPALEPAVQRVNGRATAQSWSDVLLGVQTAQQPLTVRRTREAARADAPQRATARRTGVTAKRGRRRS